MLNDEAVDAAGDAITVTKLFEDQRVSSPSCSRNWSWKACLIKVRDVRWWGGTNGWRLSIQKRDIKPIMIVKLERKVNWLEKVNKKPYSYPDWWSTRRRSFALMVTLNHSTGARVTSLTHTLSQKINQYDQHQSQPRDKVQSERAWWIETKFWQNFNRIEYAKWFR